MSTKITIHVRFAQIKNEKSKIKNKYFKFHTATFDLGFLILNPFKNISLYFD